ncbi:MAG: putative membrane-bound dehydrogenase-like protein [Kiritimatiellia bacterium]|jgi:putative membrane-bound dehydrogenase-like protein
MNKPALLLLPLLFLQSLVAGEKLSVLIVDGRNNHDWKETTHALRATLEHSGRFTVSVATAPELKTISGLRRPKGDDAATQERFTEADKAWKLLSQPARQTFDQTWAAWAPDFAAHDVVLLNYNGPEWAEPVKQSLVEYVKAGGGLVLVHAANNAFTNWDAFNQMIGLGWRKAGFGDCIKWNPTVNQTFATCETCNSGHGSKHPFQITVRKSDHPIMQGLPPVWLHGTDELYHNMRGPAKNLTVLSSAYSDPKTNGTGEHEPITYEVAYGQGRVIVTTMGHFWPQQDWWDSLYCVGFQTVLARSAEYAATGRVTLPLPDAFPTADTVSILAPSHVAWRSTESIPSPSTTSAQAKKAANPYVMLTPEEQRATFELAPGYVAELVASEPQVEEPVLTVWDGNGAMYVAEMRSYMQNVEGLGTKTMKNGRIKRLEDTNGDGRMDKVTVFVDGLNLPRAVLPLDGWIAVRETDSMDVTAYRDSNGDGVADETKLLFEYGPRSRNGPKTSVEHQDSGLIWNIDNHIYISYNMERYRFTDGTWRADPQPDHWTQWGLTHDDIGRLFWSDNSRPLKNAQHHPKYGYTVRRLAENSIGGDPITLGEAYAPDFMQVKSLCLFNDRGGAASEIRGFTSACGQSIFRGDRLPAESRGNYFFADPTIHVIRRATVENTDGKLTIHKTEPGDEEFLRSPDINCRFVNTATAPDGTLYVTDMYRGIIQDAPWLSPDPRKFIVEAGLDKNILHGRIWRVRHQDYHPGPQPRMLDESTVELVRHLEHPNGWWRDTAQRLIILRADRQTAVPLLEALFRYTQNRLARLHALWTLEGIGSVSPDLLHEALKDREGILRMAAIQILERQLKPDELGELPSLVKDRDPRVVEQLIFTLGTREGETSEKLIQEAARNHLPDRGVMLATAISLWAKKALPLARDVKDGRAFTKLNASIRTTVAANWAGALANWDRGLKFDKGMDPTHQRLVKSGEQLYFKHCVDCHGSDGKGMQVPGTELYLAPPLADSKRVAGAPEQLVPVLINGLVGPIEGKTYQAGFMTPAKALGIERDDRLAEVLSYIRYAWEQKGGPIDAETVKTLRKKHEGRVAPWTEAELSKEK